MIVARRTLAGEVAFEGLGLHGGEPVRVRLVPAESGIRFVAGGEAVDAVPSNVVDTSRCTRLRNVSTIEHLMSALAGAQVTDVDVIVDGPELPGMDGSADPFLQGVAAVGYAPLGERTLRNPFSRAFVQDGAAKVAVSLGTGHWRFEYDTTPRWPAQQTFETEHIAEVYAEQIAPARTFALEEELPMIRAAGLGRGLDETSAVVLGQDGYLNAVRFPDEPARHKLLDLIGDLYLAGYPIAALNAVGVRSGHRHHVEAARHLYEATHAGT